MFSYLDEWACSYEYWLSASLLNVLFANIISIIILQITYFCSVSIKFTN